MSDKLSIATFVTLVSADILVTLVDLTQFASNL